MPYTMRYRQQPQHRPQQNKDSSVQIVNGVKSTFIKHNFKPYFIYRLLWWLNKPIIYWSSFNTNQKIKIIGIAIGSILSIIFFYFK